MTALLTALRGTGRDVAVVQRKRRRMHVATIAAGETSWVALCGRDVPAAGASFWIVDAAEHAEQHADDMCRDCRALALLVGWVVEGLASLAGLERVAR